MKTARRASAAAIAQATAHGRTSAGTANADVSLLLVRLDGGTVRLEWDRAAFPYLVTVNWDGTDPLIVVQTRDQHRMRLLSADPARGTVAVLREDSDEHWLDIVPGVPAQTGDGRIVWTADADLILGKVARLSKRISDSGH